MDECARNNYGVTLMHESKQARYLTIRPVARKG